MGQPARQEPDDLTEGQLFADRYAIVQRLGRGGMGAVYRVRDLSLGEEIALKVLAFGPEPSPIAVLRFRKEVKLARRVTHPNVARVYDLGEHQGKLYLTMELVDGPTLRGLLWTERHLSPERAIEIGRSLAAALSAAHEVGVVHRDIKPTNILLDQSGRVVLSDFGIARGLDDDAPLTTGVLGTPHYMAPEQASGGVIDARVDVFALGLVLYEMLTGERAEGTPESLAEAMRARHAPPPLITLVLHCIERDPSARPRGAVEIARRLAAIAGEEGAGSLTLPAVAAPSFLDTISAPPSPPPASPPPKELAEERALAVLPFVYRGNKDTDYLGDVITDELVDVLCRTRGLRVLGSGATSKYREARDPRTLGRELGVFAVIDGTVQILGQKVRLSVRLADADSGVQLWSDHHEGTLGDLFSYQEAIARRVAEELRVEITTITRRGDAPSEAIEQYLSARRMLRHFDYATSVAAVQSFERCLTLAPGFTPALAGHAIATLRTWFFDAAAVAPTDWPERCRASVARALERAPDLAETHLAAGMLATHLDDFAAGVRALNTALCIAPTCAEAHEYLGLLECEAGRGESGEQRLRLAEELAPELTNTLANLARHYALHGRHDDASAALARLEQRTSSGVFLAAVNRTRIAAWRGDREVLAEAAHDERFPRITTWQTIRLYAQAILGAFTAAEIDAHLASVIGGTRNTRRLAFTAQLAVEVFASRGESEQALRHLERGAALTLIDIAWMDRCPILADLRSLPGFIEARHVVRLRADAIWNQ